VKAIFKTLGEVVLGTIGAIFILNSVIATVGTIPPVLMIGIGAILIIMRKGVVKVIPEYGKFDNSKQDAIIGMVSGLFIAKGLYSYCGDYISANIAIAFLIGFTLILFKEQISKALGGIFYG